jgi:hypothetical protein
MGYLRSPFRFTIVFRTAHTTQDIPPSTLLLSRALRHNPSFEAFSEDVLCFGMLCDLAFQSFAGLG